MIRLEKFLKTSLQDVLKMSWWRLQNVLKTSWRCLEDVFARRLEEVLKTYGQDEYIGLGQNVFCRRKAKANIFALIKTFWRRLQDVFLRRRRKTFSRRLEDVFIGWVNVQIRYNVCWVNCTNQVCISSHILNMENILFEGFYLLVFKFLALLSILNLHFPAIFSVLEMLKCWSINYICQVCKLYIFWTCPKFWTIFMFECFQ